MPEPRTLYDYPLYMFADQKKRGWPLKRTTLVFNFSPKRSGLSLDQLSVNYCFFRRKCAVNHRMIVTDIELSSNATWEFSVEAFICFDIGFLTVKSSVP